MTTQTAADTARLAVLLGSVISSAGFDLEGLTITKVGRRSVVRVVVDADGGVSLDGVAEVSRTISDALDAADYTGSAGSTSYTLEVTSPGVDRPLTEPRHWRRAIGRLVRTTISGARIEGRLLAADEHGVVLDVSGQSQAAPYDGLGEGHVQVEFVRAEGGDR